MGRATIPTAAGLDHLRGMSNPLAFGFNLLKTDRVLVHAVIFTSYEIGDDGEIKLAEPKDDPRMKLFVHYCLSNHADSKLKVLEKVMDDIEKRKHELDQLEHKIKRLSKEIP